MSEQLERRVNALERQAGDMRATVDAMRRELQVNTMATTSIKTDTAALVEFARAAEGLVKVGRFFGAVIAWTAKYVLPFVLAGTAVYAVLTGKKPPSP